MTVSSRFFQFFFQFMPPCDFNFPFEPKILKDRHAGSCCMCPKNHIIIMNIDYPCLVSLRSFHASDVRYSVELTIDRPRKPLDIDIEDFD
jgi:hypothetical protein